MNKPLVTLATALVLAVAWPAWSAPDPQAAATARKAKAQLAAKAAAKVGAEPTVKEACASNKPGPRAENIQRDKKAKRIARANACADAKAAKAAPV
ncbi:MAG: hypothetical protein V4569_16055 [Pseudomonadota bacterium]